MRGGFLDNVERYYHKGFLNTEVRGEDGLAPGHW